LNQYKDQMGKWEWSNEKFALTLRGTIRFVKAT
jgi:hypothetical protein